MPRRMMPPLLVLLLLVVVLPAAAATRAYVVIVDGLAPQHATPEHMPQLFAVLDAERERSSFFPRIRGVMPARTNPNHASLLTGAYPVAHGITGNAYWNRSPTAPVEKLDSAELLEVETLFTVAEQTRPELVTFAAFAKPKLARLFAGVPKRQRPPDTLWSPSWVAEGARDRATGYTRDADTMTAALRSMARDEPHLAVVNLADVDRTAHATGVDSPATAEAVAGADRALGRLVEHLKALGRWERSVLIVTSDHGFQAHEADDPVIDLERRLAAERVQDVRVAADGGVAHVYAIDLAPAATQLGAAAAAVERAAAIARATSGVAEVLARLPAAGVPAIAGAHADWRVEHPRVGELLLVAAPGHQFANGTQPALPGNHGRPEDVEVPLFVTGGSPAIRASAADAPPALVDLAPTIASLLRLPLPRRVDGAPLPAAHAGRRIDALLAPHPGQSPH
jgi:arylsulfatase A-like enzyme